MKMPEASADLLLEADQKLQRESARVAQSDPDTANEIRRARYIEIIREWDAAR